MAGDSDDSDKTLEPTEKRLQEAREKGDVPRSQEVRHVALLGGGLAVIAVVSLTLMQNMVLLLKGLISNADRIEVSERGTQQLLAQVMQPFAMMMIPAMGLLFVLALLGGLAQGRPTFSLEKIAPKWSKLSPVAGLKRIFGMHGVIEFFKNLLKFGIVALVVAKVVWPDRARLETLLTDEPVAMLGFVQLLLIRLFIAVLIIVCVIWVIDYVWQYQSFIKRMRMTRQEMKDEYKQSEGDPHIKARLKSLRLQRSRKRMLAQVPKASVVITNPTHFAVALAYDHGAGGAPRVVAKGVDAVAARIRTVAQEHDVPLVANPPLARAIYATVDVDSEIQPDHYKAVAEIISTILKLRGKARLSSASPAV